MRLGRPFIAQNRSADLARSRKSLFAALVKWACHTQRSFRSWLARLMFQRGKFWSFLDWFWETSRRFPEPVFLCFHFLFSLFFSVSVSKNVLDFQKLLWIFKTCLRFSENRIQIRFLKKILYLQKNLQDSQKL